MSVIQYPYIPPGREFVYVSIDNQYMRLARSVAMSDSIDKDTPTGSVIIKNNSVIGIGANGSDYHSKNPCVRVINKTPTGQGYDTCEGCHPKNHSEPRAIADARKKGHSTAGASLYLWGHWWCCRSCWDSILEAGIKDVFLITNSEKLFNDDSPENILGKQLAIFAGR